VTTADQVRTLLAALAEVPVDDEAPLALDSLTLVQLVEAIEDHFGIRVAPLDVVPARFGSIEAIARYVESRR
jgi:acyl carrier protein